MKILYRTQAIAQAGRNGEVHTLDNSLQLALALPTALGGNGKGNNPEQLLAAGYAACFSNALIHVAQKLGAPITSAPVTASVELLALADGRFNFAITLDECHAGQCRHPPVTQWRPAGGDSVNRSSLSPMGSTLMATHGLPSTIKLEKKQ
ncbi:Ohr family peroxiredoxin [Aeromonas salmonicida]|uniref:Ohr family peroxiredoxin n=1 Tax=Aeromonas salmonicida TaxID=645 RepID=UPI000A882033|nr:Ohr family peroxiredoxin [Aeromonas salmonicida]